MDKNRLTPFVDALWNESIIPSLIDYVRIPNKSPLFDPDWQAHGYMDQAVSLVQNWYREHPIAGSTIETVRLPGRTPVLLLDIPGSLPGNLLFYGHLDKQPEMAGWREGLGPWQPVVEGDRMYGRGGADDGYAFFASVAAILALEDQGIGHPRCVILIECCEESGSFDLPPYIELLADKIGLPDLVVCLDSGCGNYDRLWCTTSLRGLVSGNLTVKVLTEGVHSGDGSGIVPSSFRIARRLLSRLENEVNGEVIVREFHADIPCERRAQAKQAAAVLQAGVYNKFPFVTGVQPVALNGTELVLNRTWRPALEITGASGIPSIDNAGNVLRPFTTIKLSLRLPPTVDAQAAAETLKALLEEDPPYGVTVQYEPEQSASGWDSPALSSDLAQAIDDASRLYFGKPAMYMGEGGSIPFMGMLGRQFPEAQFLITGVLGPHSNAHGPNEFLHIPTAKRLTCCIAHVIARNG
jgi:acetylornithine deacetylase/succinyl-diaminopimelate desuccinylase-like protein